MAGFIHGYKYSLAFICVVDNTFYKICNNCPILATLKFKLHKDYQLHSTHT